MGTPRDVAVSRVRASSLFFDPMVTKKAPNTLFVDQMVTGKAPNTPFLTRWLPEKAPNTPFFDPMVVKKAPNTPFFDPMVTEKAPNTLFVDPMVVKKAIGPPCVERRGHEEIGLVKVQGDGLLVVRRPEELDQLQAPGREARNHDEISIEVKWQATTWTCRPPERFPIGSDTTKGRAGLNRTGDGSSSAFSARKRTPVR